MDKSIYYIGITAVLAAAALVVIPKQLYKRFFLYGFLFGGAGDVLIIFIFSKFFGLFRYQHLGSFGIYGMTTIWTPLSWTFAYMMFFYLMPVRKLFFVFYLLVFNGLNLCVGQVMEKFGLVVAFGSYKYFTWVPFLIWSSAAAWAYLKSERIELK